MGILFSGVINFSLHETIYQSVGMQSSTVSCRISHATAITRQSYKLIAVCFSKRICLLYAWFSKSIVRKIQWICISHLNNKNGSDYRKNKYSNPEIIIMMLFHSLQHSNSFLMPEKMLFFSFAS